MIKQRTNRNLKTDITTGFGSYSKDNTGRYYNKNGRPNVLVTGLSISESMSWYHTLINMSTGYFLLLIFSGFVLLNLIFTVVYALMGIEHLVGIRSGTAFEQFMELFYFSTQTFTTVGYGRISPMGMGVSGVATFEAFLGLLSFALATGLFYGRFSRPQAHLRFSKKALISPFKEGKALMFRVAPFKNNYLSEVEVKLTLAVKEEENGVWTNKFYPLETQISKINMLILSWTVVHPLDDKSPLYGLSEEEIIDTPMELLIFIKGFDEAYSNAVISRTSYLNTEIVSHAKFKIMYGPDVHVNTTILDFGLLDHYVMVE
ncbi:MAG: Inward rectifier potassium channel Irk [Saprospiraceae bacterium]|nr:Inward rectifier potassium channel Irk [Saprospiraceae bacterium]